MKDNMRKGKVMSIGETPIPFNEYAADLNKTTLELIEQVLLKHSRAVLEGMHSHIVHRNNRITALKRDLARLTEELETERMRLVACGVVALANTPESAAQARTMNPEYRSASCDDVVRAVDREMALREENEALRKDAERYRWLRAHSWVDTTVIKSVLNFGPGYDQTKPEVLDAAIDAFIKEWK